jgi:hypothetical protein
VNYLFFDGGPLGGMKVVTSALAGDTFISNRATYTRERKWAFARELLPLRRWSLRCGSLRPDR